MKKLFTILTVLALCLCATFALAEEAAPAEGTPLTVYVKNTAAWEIINIYAWDNYNGAATDMEWVETPMEELGDGWKSYTLNTFGKEFFLCFQNGGPVWTNDVPVEAGTTALYLDLTDTVKGEKQVCQYTEAKPLVVYVKNSAAWETVNIFAWDNYNGEATNMEWIDTAMVDAGDGWMRHVLTTYNKDFFFCFQNGGSVWTNDVPVMPGTTVLCLDLTANVKGEKQVCQYTEEVPAGVVIPAVADAEVAAEEPAAEETVAEEPVAEEPVAEEPVKEGGVELTVYVKNTAAWEIINIYAWDDYNGEATNLEWVETPMTDLGNGWKVYTLTTWKEFYLCFQNGGSLWTNDVPVEAGVTELYLNLTDKTKGDRQVCQYTDERPE